MSDIIDTQVILINTDDFHQKFKPVKNHLNRNASFDGHMFETYGKELQHIFDVNTKQPKTIWTIVEEEGELIFVNGIRFINRIGYLVTEVPFEDESVYEVKDSCVTVKTLPSSETHSYKYEKPLFLVEEPSFLVFEGDILRAAQSTLNSAMKYMALGRHVVDAKTSTKVADYTVASYFDHQSTETIVSIAMPEVTGTHEKADSSKEWGWLQANASFGHMQNGEHGVLEFIINTSLTFDDAPENLNALIEYAKAHDVGYLLFHNDN